MGTSNEKRREEFQHKVESLRNSFVADIKNGKYPDGVVMAAMWSLIGELIFLAMEHKDADEAYRMNTQSMDALKVVMNEILKEKKGKNNGN